MSRLIHIELERALQYALISIYSKLEKPVLVQFFIFVVSFFWISRTWLFLLLRHVIAAPSQLPQLSVARAADRKRTRTNEGVGRVHTSIHTFVLCEKCNFPKRFEERGK